MPALLTRMSSRPCRSTMPAGSRLERGRVGHVDAERLGRRPPRRQSSATQSRGVVAARGGDHRRALRREPLGDRAADAARRAGDERDLAGEIEHVRITRAPIRRPRDRRDRRSSTTVASRWILRTRPLSTVPGPTSTYVVTPSDARRRTTASQRTGDDTCATSASIAAARVALRLGVDVGDDRHARRRARRSARSSGASRSSAGFISAQWNGALTGSGIDALRAQRLRALAGALRPRRARRRSRPARRRSGSPG